MKDYFKKYEENAFSDLYWNIPEEQRRGKMAVLGGNEQSFRTPVKISEYLMRNFPMEAVKTVLPDSLKTKIPVGEEVMFLKSVPGGSFADSAEIAAATSNVDFSLMVGDMTKNTVTAREVLKALGAQEPKDSAEQSSGNRGKTVKEGAYDFSGNSNSFSSGKPILITRDTVDLIAVPGVEEVLIQENIIIFGSLPQWQKIFRAVYYPKILMMSQPLTQIIEALHKFTLSYSVKLITLHEGLILIADKGKVAAVPLEKSGYSPFMVWGGELAAKIAAMNLYNPGKFIEATVAGLEFLKN